VKISNFKLFHDNIWIEVDGTPVDTGLRKFGALLGDESEVGCNAVLSPGSIVGRRSVIYANVLWRGILPSDLIVKNKSVQEVVQRRLRTS
jgi:UDP-N-acetylglucosamine diphosphorylase / glucose-1-phosphate thymidylyltransferase / UDP-N-acetylgalactosamine diphosphorylase / glucosamine-1-phosphate N-acetyltransferase / galactosamine-1-phosphate N-acetyltransferase